MNNPLQRLQYLLERFIVRGPFHRLLVMAGFIALIAGSAGLIAWGAGFFAGPAEASWWAFLRLTDPGYLGDDEGTFKRILATGVTILGYVVFMGALIAIMTQWFHSTMQRLQSGVTPVRLRDHIIILGWTNRSAAIARELVVSQGRVRRFYERRGDDESSMKVVILADGQIEEVREDLRRVLGPLYDPDLIIVRVGTPLRAKHLLRVDFLHAATALLPADPRGVEHPANVDAATIKTLLSTSHAAAELLHPDEHLPFIVAELTDDRKVRIGRTAYQGPFETLATDRIIARLIAQTIRHRGVSAVYGELLGHAHGNEVYVRVWRGAAATFREVADSFRSAVPLGVVHGEPGSFDTVLRPALDSPVQTGDRIVLIASSYVDTEAGPDGGLLAGVEVTAESPGIGAAPKRRVLLLGWNRKVPVLLEEFDAFQHETFEVDLVSMIDPEDRAREVDRRVGELKDTEVTHLHADFTSEDDLEDIDLESYDSIALLAGDWLDTDALSDARTMLGSLVVHDLLSHVETPPSVVVELLEQENAELLGRHQSDDVIVSPMIVSHMLTHIALRRELGDVFEELFGPHGAEIIFVDAGEYGIETGDVTFERVRARAAAHGDVAIGLELSSDVVLNPHGDTSYAIGPNDRIVALTFY